MISRDLSTGMLRGIARYRASRGHDSHRGCCRFTPSCSHYAEEALRTRRLLPAVVLVVWRILRCNPLTPRGTVDHCRPPTAGRGLKVAAVFALSALTTLFVSWTAASAAATPSPAAQSGNPITAGGCEAYVGGVPVGTLDRDHPLQVSKGQRVVVTGKAPAAVRANPANAKVPGTTTIRIDFIENLASTDVSEDSTGVTFQKSENVDTYLKYGSGIYQVEVMSVGRPGWSCSATFYVEMNGSQLALMASIAVGGIGVASVLGATYGGPPSPGDEGLAPVGITPDELDARQAAEAAADAEADRDFAANLRDDSAFGCLAIALALLFGIIVDPWFFAAVPVGLGSDRRRVRVRGHAVLGFFGGIVAGVGLAVAGQQLNLYPLTIRTAVVYPVCVGLLGAARAWRGRAWKV